MLASEIGARELELVENRMQERLERRPRVDERLLERRSHELLVDAECHLHGLAHRVVATRAGAAPPQDGKPPLVPAKPDGVVSHEHR